MIAIDIIVCVKQVPRTGEVEVDRETGNLVREGVDSQINPYDLHALEAAMQIREETGGKVTAVSMGPPQAEDALREAIWMGADHGILLSDAAFAGADTLATSYTLASAIENLPHDLILVGMQTTDGDTAQVGPGIAEFLQLPGVSYVKNIESINKSDIQVVIDLAGDEQIMRLALPCLLTVTRELNQPRLPSFRRRLKTEDWEIETWTREDLDGDESAYFGLDGSPTRVEETFPPESDVQQEVLTGDGETLGKKLGAKLKELRYV